MTDLLKKIAWNGIQLSVPFSWDIGRIDKRHLLFNRRTHPALEIKWGPVSGRFSHRSYLRKLIRQHKSLPAGNLSEWRIPPAWERALSNFSTRGFAWQLDGNGGRGAVLHCPVCQSAAIVQVFETGGKTMGTRVIDILKSLQDHRSDGRTAWRVFDISALLPDAFQLNHFHFKPGVYELAFSSAGRRLRLLRWAPASTYLSRTDLTHFAADTLGLPAEKALTSSSPDGKPAVEWHANEAHGWWTRLSRFSCHPKFHWVRVWQVPSQNRILGIELHSRTPFTLDAVTDIRRNYRVAREPAGLVKDEKR